jgi:uncharacterized membrane protein YgcG
MKAIRERNRVVRTALVTLAAASALLAGAAPRAAAAPAATLTATSSCWLQVVNDWLRHNPEIRNLYPIPCYTQAIQKLNGYPDLQQYSSAIDDIQRALLAAIHQERGDANGTGPSSNDTGSGGGGTPTSGGGGSPPASSGGGGGSSSPISSIFHPSNAQSIPLPLLVLAGLAVLLLLAGAGTWFAKRLQARRMTPAPSPPHSR